MGRAHEDDVAIDGDPFGEPPAPPSRLPPEMAADAPKVIVRRKRQLERPVDAQPEESRADAQSRRPRVFLLPRTEDGDATEGPLEDEAAAAAVPVPAAGPTTSPNGADVAPAVVPRRRTTPEFRRAGPVTIARPMAEESRDAGGLEANPPSLTQLMAQFNEATQRLETLTSGPVRLELDLTINARWAAIDRALQALRESLPATDWEPTF